MCQIFCSPPNSALLFHMPSQSTIFTAFSQFIHVSPFSQTFPLLFIYLWPISYQMPNFLTATVFFKRHATTFYQGFFFITSEACTRCLPTSYQNMPLSFTPLTFLIHINPFHIPSHFVIQSLSFIYLTTSNSFLILLPPIFPPFLLL